MHSEAVEQRFREPRHAAVLAPDPADGRCVTGRATTPGSAAVLELRLAIADGRIRQAVFWVHGCPSTIAAADWACEWLSGRDAAAARDLDAAAIEAALELAPAKRYCGLLVEDALADALRQD